MTDEDMKKAGSVDCSRESGLLQTTSDIGVVVGQHPAPNDY